MKRLLNPNDIRLLVLRSLQKQAHTVYRDSKENQLKQKKREEEEKEKAIRRVCVNPTWFSFSKLRSVQSSGRFLAFPLS